MTLFVLEGLSASGKSTARDEVLDRHPQWIKWKGENLMRKGPGEHWKEYQRRYHEALHRLYELNPENIIIADRAFSDYAYNSNDEFRKEMKRLFACYGNVHILYFTPQPWDIDDSESFIDAWHGIRPVLEERGSRDISDATMYRQRYKNLLTDFDHTMIDTSQSPEQTADSVIDVVFDVHADTEHNPDI